VLVAVRYSVLVVRNGYTKNAVLKVAKSFICRGYPSRTAGLRKVYPHFSVMADGLVHDCEEKLRAHFLLTVSHSITLGCCSKQADEC